MKKFNTIKSDIENNQTMIMKLVIILSLLHSSLPKKVDIPKIINCVYDLKSLKDKLYQEALKLSDVKQELDILTVKEIDAGIHDVQTLMETGKILYYFRIIYSNMMH